MPTQLLNGITVAYEDVGTGPAVVLIHGHPFNRSMWVPQIKAFSAAGWRVIAPDLRGYGDSSVVPGKTTIDVFAHDIAALLDFLDIASAVIVGLSMGGQIVMEFARLFPQRVNGLVLSGTYPQAETDEGKVTRLKMADRLLQEGMDAYADEVLPKMIAPHNIIALPDVASDVLKMMKATDPEGAAAAIRGRVERPSYETVLANLDVRALIILGSEDTFASRADAVLMHGLLKKSELVVIEGVGHMPNLESASEFNAAFLRVFA